MYYLYDGKGNVERISAEWGRVKETYNYDPYGNLTYGIPDTVNYYGYNGESSNLATGLQYLRARYYNPHTGNFLTEDTYAGQKSNPLTLNRYDYVSNNPVNYIDPSGHYSLKQFGKDVGNFFGGIYDAFQRGYDIQQKNQQYETQLIADLVFGDSDKSSKDNIKNSGKTDKISSDTAQELAENKNNPLHETVNQIVSVHEKQQQAEMEIQKIYCEGLEEPDAGTKVAIGAGVIVATLVTTGISGGLTTPQLLCSIVGGMVGALVSYALAEDDKEAAAADGFMWGTVTGVALPTIGMLVGALGEMYTVLSAPAIAAALEAFFETLMESFIALIQGAKVSIAVFLTDFAWNIVTSGPNDPMKQVREWFKKNADDASAFIKKLLKRGNDIEITFPEGDAQLKHIFRDAEGHLPDTPENRQKILDVTSNLENYLGKDARGNDWYAIITEDGTQTWVRVRNGVIDNAGVNNVPRTWDPETGLYKNTKK